MADPRRIGPPPLARYPEGLLDFFSIKNGGEFPQTLLPSLAPVLDLFDHYTGTAALTTGNVFNLNAEVASRGRSITAEFDPVPLILGGSNLVVPTQEWWYIREANVDWFFNAADESTDAQLSIAPGGQAVILMPFGPLMGYTQGVAIDTRMGSRSLARPQWVRPGSVIFLAHAGITGAASVTFNVNLAFNRFRI